MPHNAVSRASPDSRASGAEVREDVPLKAGGGWGGAGSRCLAGGPRLILAAFAALSAAITLALLTQIYYGDYEVVPHGVVSSCAAACSRAGTDALKAGGRAMDATAAAALCLAVLAPHRTSLDASGSMLYWEYRESRTREPTLYEWGGPVANVSDAHRPPRLVAALAALHARHGALPWARVLEPAIRLARYGYEVSEGLSQAGGGVAGTNTSAPQLATFLQSLLPNSSSELWRAWGAAAALSERSAARVAAGAWRAYGPPALRAALPLALPLDNDNEDDVQVRIVEALVAAPALVSGGGVSTALAAVDSRDTYVALATGLSVPFGSGRATPVNGWVRDEPDAPLDLAPALLLDDHICGTRYVIGAESSAALAQAAGALVGGGAPGAVERARVALAAAPGERALPALEAARPAGTLPLALLAAATVNATPPYAAVNLVMQRADALSSHADSRGGGLASRF